MARGHIFPSSIGILSRRKMLHKSFGPPVRQMLLIMAKFHCSFCFATQSGGGGRSQENLENSLFVQSLLCPWMGGPSYYRQNVVREKNECCCRCLFLRYISNMDSSLHLRCISNKRSFLHLSYNSFGFLSTFEIYFHVVLPTFEIYLLHGFLSTFPISFPLFDVISCWPGSSSLH